MKPVTTRTIKKVWTAGGVFYWSSNGQAIAGPLEIEFTPRRTLLTIRGKVVEVKLVDTPDHRCKRCGEPQ